MRSSNRLDLPSSSRFSRSSGLPNSALVPPGLDDLEGTWSGSWTIRTALEAAGVEFIAENDGGAGVRLRK
uniref:hypothetical protein n=1 Tax=Roseomonas mucosa TaxID=207340 RepID=UPI0038D24A19